MRARIGALAALAAIAAACSGGGGGATAHPPPACPALKQSAIPLAVRLATRPAGAAAICPLLRYQAVFGTSEWGDVPAELRAVDRGVQVWQERSLLYTCRSCPLAGFHLTWVRQHHPDWILHSADGAEIHPHGRPDEVLLDFGNPEYQNAWATRVRESLQAGGWTGVAIVDAVNDPDWSAPPERTSADPGTGPTLQGDTLVTSIAQALSLIHAAMRTRGFFVLAENDPPRVVEPSQINSADAVSAGSGFARLEGDPWLRLLRYYVQAQRDRGAVYVWEAAPQPGGKRAVYGLAGYLLVATPRGAYGVGAGGPPAPLYNLDLGPPNPDVLAVRIGEAWRRTYPRGEVAVNPSPLPTTLTLGSAGSVTLPPESAAIAVGSTLVTSY